jgi:hypothetical protein
LDKCETRSLTVRKKIELCLLYTKC